MKNFFGYLHGKEMNTSVKYISATYHDFVLIDCGKKQFLKKWNFAHGPTLSGSLCYLLHKRFYFYTDEGSKRELLLPPRLLVRPCNWGSGDILISF